MSNFWPQSGTFKPQRWHVENRSAKKVDVLASFVSRTVAEEVRDQLNADVAGFKDASNDEYAFTCLCDCENRECRYA